MGETKKRKRYNHELKIMIVHLYHSESLVKGLHNEYSVSEITIYKWIKDVTPFEGANAKKLHLEKSTSFIKENLRLKQKLKII